MFLDGLLGNLNATASYKAQAGITRANAAVTRASGRVARAQAYGRALRTERENEVSGRLTAENMQRVHESKRKAQAAAVAARGASGFTAEGSGANTEVSALEMYERAAQDMATSRALQDVSARFSAQMDRVRGDLEAQQADNMAEYQTAQAGIYSRMASKSRTSAALNAVGTAMGAALGLATGGGFVGGLQGAQFGSAASGTYNQFANFGSWEAQTGKNEDAQKEMLARISSWLS